MRTRTWARLRRALRGRQVALAVLALLLLGVWGCVPGDGKHNLDHPAGFLWAVWHGWIAPVSLVWGFFNPDIRVYEVVNTGWWYDFGYYIAIISGFGGLSLFRRHR